MINANAFRGKPINTCQGRTVEKSDFEGSYGYTEIRPLTHLHGLPWNDLALAWVTGLRPSRIRVIAHDEGEQCDAQCYRVTVQLNADDTIHDITQEVEVWLPEGVQHGWDLEKQTEAQRQIPIFTIEEENTNLRIELKNIKEKLNDAAWERDLNRSW